MTDSGTGGADGGARLDRKRFSSRLSTFHRRLAGVDWAREAPTCVFVRDYGGLPDRAPFDIDIMVDASEVAALGKIFERIADQTGIASIVRNVPSGLHILTLDLAVAPARRTWAYYEVATNKRLTAAFHLYASDIDVVRDRGLPVPDLKWGFLIDFLQALRKRDMGRYQRALEAAIDTDGKCVDLAVSRLGATAEQIRELLADPSGLEQLASAIGVEKKPEKKVPRPKLRTRLQRAALERLYVLPARSMNTFTIHGADGVGKSTACNIVRDMFAGYPLGMEAAHHVTSWKRRLKAQPPDPATEASLTHKMLRVIYRAAPRFARDFWVTSSGYHRYSKNVNAEVYRSWINGKILLLDRYIYDVWVKDRVRRSSSLLADLVGALHCFVMRRPSLAVVLLDDPASIVRRKQELSETEIADYQRLMRSMLQLLRVRSSEIHVGGRTPEDIGRELARSIIDHIGVGLHNLMREETRRGADAPGQARV